MKELTLYREYNGQYSTSESQQDDVSGVYVQKEHLTDLQKQNDELRASNSQLRKELEYFTGRVERGTITSKATYNRFMVSLSKTPAQSLADIRAEAVRDYEASLSSFAWTAEEYIANRIKEG